jgi:hypothetical protein
MKVYHRPSGCKSFPSTERRRSWNLAKTIFVGVAGVPNILWRGATFGPRQWAEALAAGVPGWVVSQYLVLLDFQGR